MTKTQTRLLSWSEALEACKAGYHVMRHGWDDKGMWLFYVPAEACQVPHKFGSGYPVMASIWMKTADDKIVPWLCSQSDALATDWEVIPGSPQYIAQL